MDKIRAEAIAETILEPGLKAQEENRLKKAKKAASLAVRHRFAGFYFIGFAVGLIVGYFISVPSSCFVGGLIGAVIWRFTHWHVTYKSLST